jgi:small-conductance mechanosensitive channel
MPTLLVDLWNDLHDVRVLWQLAVIAAGLALAWGVGRRRETRGLSPDETGKFARGGLQRLQFPLTALVIVLIGRAVLRQWQPVNLLDVAVPLLTALAIVRTVVYALRRVFAPSGWLRLSERFISWAAWLGFALHITGLAPLLIDFLRDIGFTAGNSEITLLDLVNGILAVMVTLLGALWLGRGIEARLLRATGLDANLRLMLAKLAQALLVLTAVLIALPAVGLDLTVLSIFGGAVGVGLGFGLQKIASNYVSGFIILMDRSVGIGHVLTVDRYSGELIKMTARYVVMRGADGTETLIPNETLVTTPVVNHTYTDRRVRVAVPLQVDYRSDLPLALRLMKDEGTRLRRALREPSPEVLIKQFGENGIEVELGVWVEDARESAAELRSDLYSAIWDAFRAHGVQMPPPKHSRPLDARTAPADAPVRDGPPVGD